MVEQMDFDSQDDEADRLRRLDFWESLRSWFEERGYFLFEVVDSFQPRAYAQPTREYNNEPRLTHDDDEGPYDALKPIPKDCNVEDPFPYAFMGPKRSNPRGKHLPYTVKEYSEGHVMYAQDVEGRHIVVKLVKGGSDEYEVLRLLKDQSHLRDRDSFPSVIPILDLLPYNNDWFLVMPRWEEKRVHPVFFPTFQIAIRYIISLLEGLAFLHELRIFHRDISGRNILVNHFTSYQASYLQSTISHQCLQHSGTVRYAIADFDLAMLLDKKTYGSNPRLPIEKVMMGSESRPYETMHAHVDFDPFKYDVACLGIHLAEHFQHIIIDVPLLAPLIDRMVTPNIRKRFTASEALAFAQTIPPTISMALGNIERQIETTPPYYAHDRWAGLPKNFIKKWGSYRVNISSWSMRLQNWFFQGTRQRWAKLYYCRYPIHVLTRLPNFMFRRLLSLAKMPSSSV